MTPQRPFFFDGGEAVFKEARFLIDRLHFSSIERKIAIGRALLYDRHAVLEVGDLIVGGTRDQRSILFIEGDFLVLPTDGESAFLPDGAAFIGDRDDFLSRAVKNPRSPPFSASMRSSRPSSERRFSFCSSASESERPRRSYEIGITTWPAPFTAPHMPFSLTAAVKGSVGSLAEIAVAAKRAASVRSSVHFS